MLLEQTYFGCKSEVISLKFMKSPLIFRKATVQNATQKGLTKPYTADLVMTPL